MAASGALRIELVRIRREIKRAAEMRGEAAKLLDQASKDHQRVVRQLSTVRNPLLRAELTELAARVRQDGLTVRGLIQ